MTDEAEWKKRFLVFSILRIAGLALFLLGIGIAFTGLLKPGGWPLLGGILAIVGALEAVLIGRILKKAWRDTCSGSGSWPKWVRPATASASRSMDGG